MAADGTHAGTQAETAGGRARRGGYALSVVLMVLALLSVSLGTLLYFMEASARTTGSMLGRRQAFYACDGIGRATTALAQQYLITQAPTTEGLIDAVCAGGGGGCCASATGAVGACGGPIPRDKTAFTSNPLANGPTALPRVVPPGFKLTALELRSQAQACVTSGDCTAGTCVAGRCRVTAPLPNGPFVGMSARQDTIELALRAEDNGGSRFVCATRQSLNLGKIALFQFFAFSESPITDWHPGPEMFATGRLHANGDVCVGGSSGGGLYLDRVTASGDVRHFSDAACPYTETDNSWSKTFVANVDNPDFDANDDGVADDPVAADFTALTATARSDAGAGWGDFASTTWNGHLLDRAHGVPRLKLPIVGVAETQAGFDARGQTTSTTLNRGNSRLLVDPVRPADAADLRAQKFAHKADIRIVNGIWYLKNRDDPAQWPGIPVWSDHGGRYTTSNAHDGDGTADSFERGNNPVVDAAVGQAELRVARGWVAGDQPRLFSYYGSRDDNGKLLAELLGPTGQPEAVISYGTLVRRGSGHTTTWRPGVRSLHQPGPRYSFCGQAPAPVTPTAGAPFRSTILDALSMPCAPASFLKADGATAMAAGDEGDVAAAALVGATRSGFRDGHAQEDPAYGDTSRAANILPINFDVGALQRALASTRQGELGWYFCADATACACTGTRGCQGAPFNGIVWIGATWPAAASPDNASSEAGYPDGTAGRPAAQGGRDDDDESGTPVGQPDAVRDAATGTTWVDRSYRLLSDLSGRETRGDGCTASNLEDCTGDEQAALPWALCSQNTSGTAPAGAAFDDTGLFVRPDCDVADTSRPGAVRVFNARNLNLEVAVDAPDLPGAPQLPAGLSVVSNLPVYVMGDVNLASDPDGRFPVPAAPDDATPATWWPLLIGGDVVHLLSNAWDDRRSRWGVATGDKRFNAGDLSADGVRVNPRHGADVDPRPADETWYYVELMAGWGPSAAGVASGGLQNFPRFLEDWGGVRARIRGSIVIGHNKVYARQRWHCCNAASFSPPQRDWGFDRTLEDLQRQPPGTPVYDVAAVRQWERN